MAAYPAIRPAVLRPDAADSFSVSRPIEPEPPPSWYDVACGYRYPQFRREFFNVHLRRRSHPVCRRQVSFPQSRFYSFERSDERWAIPLGIASVSFIPLQHGDSVELSDIFFVGNGLMAVVEHVECEDPVFDRNWDAILWYRADLRVVLASDAGLDEFAKATRSITTISGGTSI